MAGTGEGFNYDVDYDVDDYDVDYDDYLDISDGSDAYTAAIYALKFACPLASLLMAAVGNTLSFCIMWRLLRPLSWVCAYPMVLGVVDTVFLLLGTLNNNKWMTLVTSRNIYMDIIAKTDARCKLYQFVFNFFTHLGSWTTVCMAVELYRSTVEPTRWKYFERQRVVDTFVLLTAALSIYSAHYFFTWGLGHVEIPIDDAVFYYLVCTYSARDLQGYETGPTTRIFLEQLHWIVSVILPVFIIVVCLCKVMYVRSSYVMVYPSNDGRYDSTRIKGRHLLYREMRDKTFVVILVMFLVCQLPYYIVRESNDFLLDKRTQETERKWNLAIVLTEALWSVNLSGKFVVYLVTCKQFRAELCQFFYEIRAMFLQHIL